MRKPSERVLILSGLAIGALVLITFIWSKATFNSDINFLTSHSRAEWIVYPEVPTGGVRSSLGLSATFRRLFVLSHVEKDARISIRAMKRWNLSINGVPVNANAPNSKWKEATEFTVNTQLHPGTNEIAVMVFNSNGPPALWLSLSADEPLVTTDSRWTVHVLDSVECNAQPATMPAQLRPGNRLLVAETPLSGFRRHSVFFISLFVICVLVLMGLLYMRSRNSELFDSNNFALGVLLVPVLSWVVLYYNNLPILPVQTGFDASDHLNYIQYVASKSSLPLANEGWQMYQPPLYYAISSVFLNIADPTMALAGKVMIIRVLGLCIGIVHFTLILLSLRLVFPRRVSAQFFGLMLAAFVPAHLYMSQYVTNESLAAMLVTASFYLCLRINIERIASRRMLIILGLCLGAALLAKVTAVIAVPFVAAAMLDPTIPKLSNRLENWLLKTGTVMAACLLACGWYYYRVWSHFGSALVGNWDSSAMPSWWMQPGFETWGYFFRFGQCLIHPWFAGLNGFADGLYSTLWGDGLLGGRTAVEHRPPWNYELMGAGYLLALVPSLIIVVGLVAAVRNFIRRPDYTWLLVLGMPFTILGALVWMNIKIPTYGEAKAFYGLVTLLPVCVAGGLGYDVVKRMGRPILYITTVVFGVWAMNSYFSFWIQNNNAETHSLLAVEALQDNRVDEALEQYAEAVRLAPNDIKIKAVMSRELVLHGRAADVKKIAEQALKDPLTNGDSHYFLADVLAADGRMDAAINEARQSIELAPDNQSVYGGLCQWLCDEGRYSEAITAGRNGERVNPFREDLHFNLGRSFTGLGDETNAAMHLRLAVRLNPRWPYAHDQLGVLLTTQQNYAEATNQLLQAVQLDPRNVEFRLHLARTFACANETQREVEQYREILKVDPEFLPALNNLAWRLATSPNLQTWDGPQALQLASKMCRLTQTNDARSLEILAAAYSRAGRFEEAAQSAQKAIQLAERDGQTNATSANPILQQLSRSNRPYVEETALTSSPILFDDPKKPRQ